ncbi:MULTISPECIES: alpha-galactosidase [unclassified Streptomyces]|uniref:alpha-galactosidase n=1 Tax=unclassified Streptomyces TaxID=2593676 RepID=UPI00116406FC|nr:MULTISPECIES: alpha-galactosidase [unclassified Streptomyces]QDN54757.1 alpha-galactosidase [Streptomyces sp. S1D4-20]QDN64939.1 alpha-galactosidase [Streptomyces sp. S1D4-14]QDN75255.1 alpha-galactosidase [Streptomyces sp. S1A1-7]QDO47346.1 alpha-galactosidase [Streptomyces sp. RLB3-5]QDO57585.1 alpha-galactosidase [Streptomyces sp. RLB1-8]
MTVHDRWLLRTDTTTYAVTLGGDDRWAELAAWGPHGVEDGPSPMDWSRRTHFILPADATPAEYIPYGLRPFTGADLVASRPGGDRGSWWRFAGATQDGDRALRLEFADDVLGLRTTLQYETVPGTDVVLRWTELTCTGETEVRLERFDSAAVNVPVQGGARLTYLAGQWSQEFQLKHVELERGRFEMESTQGSAGHAYHPWLAVQDAAAPAEGATPTYGIALEWSGNWRITADAEPGGAVRVRAGRVPHEGAVRLAPGATLVTPRLACAFSPDGLDGLARVWHRYERHLTGERIHRPRKVLYNSWEATGFDVDAAGQLELAKTAADLGAELFVVDDGWFTGRADDTGGLGDWDPDPAEFPGGFDRFVEDVRALGMDFGLWVEPEGISPRSRLYAEHPEWVYRIEGRPATLVRNQLLLDLGREDVQDFVIGTLDRLLGSYAISYLKWDMNRPPTERGRPGHQAGPDPERQDLDAAHVAGYLRVLDHLRTAHPHVTVEGCAGGGARVEHATLARTDVMWPSDNTAPMDRLRIQYGYLHAHAPHTMSSWVTDAPGVFDPRPRSLAFRFVNSIAGVLGIGADIRHWTPQQRAEAGGWIARYKEIRDIVHHGEVSLLGSPADPTCGIQYEEPGGARLVVTAWNTGPLDGAPLVPGRAARLRLRGLRPDARYTDTTTGTRYSGAYLLHSGLPFAWTTGHDAELTVLARQ